MMPSRVDVTCTRKNELRVVIGRVENPLTQLTRQGRFLKPLEPSGVRSMVGWYGRMFGERERERKRKRK